MILALLGIGAGQNCHNDAQRAEFRTLDSIAAGDELAQAMDAIDAKLQPQSGWFNSTGVIYNITKLSPRLQYLEYGHKAVPSETVESAFNISGGTLWVDFEMEYNISGSGPTRSGLAGGRVVVDNFWYVKRLIVLDGTIAWDLQSYKALDEKSVQFLIQFSRPQMQDIDKHIFQTNILNLAGSGGIRGNVLLAINANLNSTVQDIMNHERLLTDYFNYTYTKGMKSSFVTPYIGLLFTKNVGPNGLTIMSYSEVRDYNGTECGIVPTEMNKPYNFGGHQIFLSMPFFKSSAKYALEKGLFDANLSRRDWDSPVFQFFVGDLSRAVAGLQTLSPDTPLQGSCKFSKQLYQKMFTVQRQTTQSLRVQIPVNCTLQEMSKNTTVLTNLGLGLTFVLKPVMTQHELVVEVKQAKYMVYDTSFATGLSIRNAGLFYYFVDSLVGQLAGSRTYGTGFKFLEPMRKPGVYVNNYYVLFFDSSVKS